jgi:hypothetical protein
MEDLKGWFRVGAFGEIGIAACCNSQQEVHLGFDFTFSRRVGLWDFLREWEALA